MATTTQTEIIQSEALEMNTASTKTEDPTLGESVTPQDTQDGHAIGRATYFKFFSAGFCFFVAGINDGSIGALLPYVIREYNVSKAIVSSV